MLSVVKKPANNKPTKETKLRSKWNEAKKDLGLTQEIAAEQLGWKSQSNVAAYLNGQREMTIDVAVQFARLLKCPASDIWEGDPLDELIRWSPDQVEELVDKYLTPERKMGLVEKIIVNRQNSQAQAQPKR